MDADLRYQFPTLSTMTISIIAATNHTESWTIIYPQDFAPLLATPEALNVLQNLVAASGRNYRQQVDFAGVALLAGVFYDEKTVRLYSPRLGHELFLVQEIQYSSFANDEDRQDYRHLKLFTEKVASLAGQDFPSQHELITQRENMARLLDSKSVPPGLQARMDRSMQELKDEMAKYQPVFFERLSDFALGLTAKFALLRIHLLKFLAILPGLDHDQQGHQVKRILLEALRRLIDDSRQARVQGRTGQERPLPQWIQQSVVLGHAIVNFLPAGPLSAVVRWCVKLMAKRFIAGESIDRAQEGLGGLLKSGRDATLDQLGELVVSAREADRYANEVMTIIRGMHQYILVGERNRAGILRAHVSIKVSALAHDFRPEAFDETYAQVAPRLRQILLCAKKEVVFINIDAEHYHFRDIVFNIYCKVLLETPELKNYKDTGIVLQAYLRDAVGHLRQIVELARERGLTMPVRLVKGAYWDAETVEADAHNFIAPQFLNKEETDLNYRQLTWEMFKAFPHVQLCLAGHNLADHCWAIALREELFATLPPIEHQCLHMTYEALSTSMGKMGWVVRNYVPVGSLLVGMAYLVRRIMENSSQVGVLTIMRSHKKKGVLPAPENVHLENKEKTLLVADKSHKVLTHEFFNISPLRPYLPTHLNAITLAYDQQAKTGARKFAEDSDLSGEWQKIYSSSDPTLLVGEIRFATVEDVQKKVLLSDQCYNNGEWAKAPWAMRVSVILRVARMMLAQRNQLSALISYEAGKSMKEALGDVDEAVDFLNFYAREEARLAHHKANQMSRGIVAAVTPWNFPLAIPCGMVAAPLVAGNTVILKSAEQTPLIAQALVDLFHAAGLPKDVLIHLPGEGESVGDALISHARVAMVVFTGSKNVGQYIYHKVSQRTIHNHLFNYKLPARAITEMGGKNAIIVTSNAELDETVTGILQSAYGHAGQKCSAASRVIVHESVRQKLLERLQEACADISVGKAWNFATAINPVISKHDQERLCRQVDEACLEAKTSGGKVWVNRARGDYTGFGVGPTVIELPRQVALNRNSFAQRELFGPVLHVVGFRENHEALAIFNSSEYALTGGIYSQSQDDIDFFTDQMLCGNLYVNRPITGARVGIEPFGGFKLSGTGPKAGGQRYLSAFHAYPVNNPALSELARPTPPDEKGEEYQFSNCRPSGLSLEKRLARIDRGIENLLNNFESLFQGIYGENKKVLIDYRRWIKRVTKEMLEKSVSNTTIPGQLSFNRFNLNHSHLVVAAFEYRAYFSSMMYVLNALVAGTGITVVARNQSAYIFWGQFKLFFQQAGIGSFNFDVYFGDHERLVHSIVAPELSLVLVDGDYHHYEQLTQTILAKGTLPGDWIKTFLTPFDAPQVDHYQAYLEQFCLVRSFAVNTMRHGAPLDLELK